MSILRHLCRNPGAKDTLEGMIWWIVLDRCKLGTEQIGKAAAGLVQEGLLTSKRLGSQGPVYYALNEARIRDVWRLVYSGSHLMTDGQ